MKLTEHFFAELDREAPELGYRRTAAQPRDVGISADRLEAAPHEW